MGHLARDCRQRSQQKVRPSCDLHHIDLQQQFGVYGASDRVLTVKVPVWQNEPNYECTIDTGASVSLLPLSVVVGLDLNAVNDKLQLTSVSGAPLDVHGTVSLSVRLGEWETNHTFIVADIQTALILGADVLALHDMTVDLRAQRLDRGMGHVNLIINHLIINRHDYEQHRVILHEDTTILENHRIITNASVVDVERMQVLEVSPSLFELVPELTTRTGALVARAVVNVSNGSAPVQLMSVGGPIHLRKRTSLATFVTLPTQWRTWGLWELTYPAHAGHSRQLIPLQATSFSHCLIFLLPL